ncbi:protein FAM177A1-like [Gigantopelta aegis]|uniref:protein FAM177A1-like n=1 Tax=Gigantopelta aegis TaxID=1735272 RepID=UPI001B889252|nr:protein FAM177A1-like [Gigantopelta aegis]
MSDIGNKDQTSGEAAEFTNILLDPDKPTKKKVPKRVLHFSDGILEEYSSDEDEDKPPPEPPVDPKTLTWFPWFWHYIVTVASRTLSAADLCGEKLAWFFGITSPKYQYAIDEYYRLKEEEEKEKARMEAENTTELSSVDVKVVEDKNNDSVVQKY